VTSAPFLSRREQFGSIESTNDIVRDWLAAGTPELCLAVAAEQTAGRGRQGRSWVAPEGTALLLSLGFRPSYLQPDRLWRLSAVVALSMVDAAEDVAGLPPGALRLKWPNDIVVDRPDGLRKLAGLLGETVTGDGAEPLAVVGIGTNADWPAERFPAELAGSMTSLRAISGRPVDTGRLLDEFLMRLEPRVLSLREGRFDVAGWHDRQATTGRLVRLEATGGEAEEALAVGVDGASGALIVRDPAGGPEREVPAGEVTGVRLAETGGVTQ
jgi:BirA family biotin operon repressor/biotin-[acetyl-CoA-carboxylase] ligase